MKFVLLISVLLVSGCGLTLEEGVKRANIFNSQRVEQTKKCSEVGLGVYRGESGFFYCDTE
jgi:hypothetical protein